jgi:hypothetical protein
MKNKFFFYLLSSVLVLGFFSCKKAENQVTLQGGTAPVLKANVATTIPLTFATQSDEALKLTWTNPEYQFNTGTSSLDVTYQIEIDTAGANFNSANKKVISISKDLSYTFTQSELNDYLLNTLRLLSTRTYNVDFRVKSFLPNNNSPLISNTVRLAARPFAIPPKVLPPASGKLYIVGDATNGGWNNPVPVPTQEFTQVSPTEYKITVSLIGGKSYLLLPVNGDWGDKYGATGANNSNLPLGDDFKRGGGDMLAPPTSGTYTITVDFQRGKYTIQ